MRNAPIVRLLGLGALSLLAAAIILRAIPIFMALHCVVETAAMERRQAGTINRLLSDNPKPR